jgi:hypothetical protein
MGLDECGGFVASRINPMACSRLQSMMQPGITAAALYDQYVGFGDDPLLLPVDPNDGPVAFSAWDYAKERCEVLGSPVA